MWKFHDTKKFNLFLFPLSCVSFSLRFYTHCKNCCCRSSASLNICKFILCNVKNLSCLDFVSCSGLRATLFFFLFVVLYFNKWTIQLIVFMINNALVRLFFTVICNCIIFCNMFLSDGVFFLIMCIIYFKNVYGIFGILGNWAARVLIWSSSFAPTSRTSSNLAIIRVPKIPSISL